MTWLGVDPGANGGACLVGDRGEPVAAMAWGAVAAGVRVRTWGHDIVDGENLLTGPDVPERLGKMCGWLGIARDPLAVYEGLFVGRSVGSSAPSTLMLAEWVGEHRAGLRSVGVRVSDARPLAQTWRRHQLGRGMGHARRDEAEGAAVRAASSWLPPWTRRERGAIAEAWLLARCAAGMPPVEWR